MKLPAVVKAVRDAYARAFPIPRGIPGDHLDDECRRWCSGLASQVRFTTNDPTWGIKRADAGRPLSKDTIAKRSGATLLIWDLISGASGGNGQLVDDPDSQDVSDQVFVDVAPIDVLHQAPIPIPEPPPAPHVDELAAVLREALPLLRAIVDAAEEVGHNALAISEQLGVLNRDGIKFHFRP